MRLFLHYTEPGDVCLDGFVGTGMTAVGAQLCGDINSVEGLGYSVDRKSLAVKGKDGKVFSRLGGRVAFVSDLCPAATHLCYNFNSPFDEQAFEKEIDVIADAVERDCGWMYRTRHGQKGHGQIVCVLWSDVFVCSNCEKEIVFWDAAVDAKNNEVSETVTCKHCKAGARKAALERSWTNEYDSALKRSIRQAKKQVPVTIIYEVDGKRFEKNPDDEDLTVLHRIADGTIPYFFPSDRMPDGDESRRNDPLGDHSRPSFLHQTQPLGIGLRMATRSQLACEVSRYVDDVPVFGSVRPKDVELFCREERKATRRMGWHGTVRYSLLPVNPQ